MLAPGDWSMVHNPDIGSAVVFKLPDAEDTEPDITIDLEEQFKKVVFRHPTGELFYTEGKGKPMSLDSARTRYAEGDISVKAGVSVGTYKLKVYIFHWARPCFMRMYWDLSQLYVAFSMTSNKGAMNECDSPQPGLILVGGHPRELTAAHPANMCF